METMNQIAWLFAPLIVGGAFLFTFITLISVAMTMLLEFLLNDLLGEGENDEF